MLTNRDIIVLALPRWDGKYKSTSLQIARQLAKKNRVLYIDNPFTFVETVRNIRSPQIKRRWRKFLPFSNGLTQIEIEGISLQNLTTPPVLPINALPEGIVYRFLAKINHRILGHRIQKAIKKLEFKNYIYINSFNFYYPDLDTYLKPVLSIYHCVDGMVRRYTLRHGPHLEKRLLKKVDLVISTSKALQTEKAKINPNSYFIPNAADFDLCSKALDERTKTPWEFSGLKKPIIGYFGNIERRIDYQLLKKIFERRTDWTLAMVGPVEMQFLPDWFTNLKNVKLFGAQPYHRLPEFLKGFDVAIIPFKIDEVSHTIYPLKLFEYLGGGKPVVSTLFNPDLLMPLQRVVYLAQDADHFEHLIRKAYNENSEMLVKERINIARQNTWQSRGEAFARLVQKWLNKKEKP